MKCTKCSSEYESFKNSKICLACKLEVSIRNDPDRSDSLEDVYERIYKEYNENGSSLVNLGNKIICYFWNFYKLNQNSILATKGQTPVKLKQPVKNDININDKFNGPQITYTLRPSWITFTIVVAFLAIVTFIFRFIWLRLCKRLEFLFLISKI